jgi:hypothetical protein
MRALWLVLLLGVSLATVAARETSGRAAEPEVSVSAAKSRFQQAAAREAASSGGETHAGGGGHSGESAGAGGEWWVKDVPWFLPPPPEWGPLPPTMYTSYYHRPRYPALSTANYYPLYSRSDEYDAHLPASMSRRHTLDQQMMFDNYVSNYYAHTHYTPTGNPNLGISDPRHFGNSAAMGGLGEAHARVLTAQSTNNYFPLFSRTNDFYTSPINTYRPSFANPAFLEQRAHIHHPMKPPHPLHHLQHHSAQYGDRAVTYFASSHIPLFRPRIEEPEDDH